MRKRGRRDANQGPIVETLVAVGATVTDLASVGGGVPDLLVGFRGGNYLLEIKNGGKSPSRQKLTFDQILYHATWRGSLCVVTNEAEALKAIGAKVK